jgi:hypothetical protein
MASNEENEKGEVIKCQWFKECRYFALEVFLDWVADGVAGRGKTGAKNSRVMDAGTSL